MTSKPILAVDCDDVLCEYVPGLIEWHNATYKTTLTMADFTSFHFSTIWGGTNDQVVEKVNLFSETEQYKNLKVLEGAQEALTKLAEKFTIVIVTARFPDRTAITREYLDRHFPNLISQVFHTFDKATVCKEMDVKVFIDDGPHNVEKCKAVVPKTILFNKGYGWSQNCSENNVIKCSSWTDVVQFLGF